MSQLLRFAMRGLSRDLRAGELKVLSAAIILAVSAMTAVGFFTDRIAGSVRTQASGVLAADLVIRSPLPVPPEFLDEARDLGLATAETLGFPSVATAAEDNALVMVKAVSDGYPLRGTLKISDELFGVVRDTQVVPGPGEVWAEPGVLARLGLDVGDQLGIGDRTLNITQVLEYRPDQNLGFVGLAPALLVNLADVPAMGVVRQGSRVTYRQLFSGPASGLEELRDRLEPRLPGDAVFQTLEDAGEAINNAIGRSQRFLNLASLVTLILAAVATAMAARRYMQRHLDNVALFRTMGASRAFIRNTLLLQLAVLTALTGLVGIALGFLFQQALASLIADFTEYQLPPPTTYPALLGLATAATVVIGFALPHLMGLARVVPLRVLRRDLPPPAVSAMVTWGMAVGALVALIFAIVGDGEMLAYISGGLLALGVVAAAAGWLLVRGFTRFRGIGGAAWRYGLANVSRRGAESVIQVVAFGLGLMVLLLLTVVRNDLLGAWQDTLPEGAPNNFLINIQPEEWPGIRELFVSELGTEPQFAPLIRGRVTHVKGQDAEALAEQRPGAQQFLTREANFTWFKKIPETNQLRSGEWWPADYDGPIQVSLEEDIALRIGAGLGDKIGFSVGGESFDAVVTSIRFVQWESFTPNFYVVLSPGAAEQLPQTYISSIHVPPEKRSVLNTLVRTWRSVTVLDLEVVISQVRMIIDRASQAVQFVFLFTLAAGVVVLLAAVQMTRDERRFESAILHTLGASRRRILAGVVTEFVSLGALSGVLAALGASAVGFLLADRLFDLGYTLDPWLWALGLVSGGILVGISGVLATRKAVNEPPVAVLRRG